VLFKSRELRQIVREVVGDGQPGNTYPELVHAIDRRVTERAAELFGTVTEDQVWWLSESLLRSETSLGRNDNIIRLRGHVHDTSPPGAIRTMRFQERLVDRLPRRLWRPGNLYRLPAGDWHFCTAEHPETGRSVRTVEWRGRPVARGRTPFVGHVE
jgi:hypothetical protein